MTKINYELKYLQSENERLNLEIDKLKTGNKNKIDKNFEQDIKNLIQISMKMKNLLEQCRSQTMLPIDLGKQIDKVIKEIENYS